MKVGKNNHSCKFHQATDVIDGDPKLSGC